MSGFLIPPTFVGPYYNIPTNLPIGYVLTLTASGPKFQAAGGGGSAIGTYFLAPTTTGVYNNFALAAGVGRVDFDTTTGNIELTGIAVAGVADAQLLIVRNIGANLVLLDSENAGSLAANRMQLIGQIALPKFASQLVCYYGGSIDRWAEA